MRDLIFETITLANEELTRLQYEKESLKQITKANSKKLKIYELAKSEGLEVEEPILQHDTTEEIDKEIKIARTVISKLESILEKYNI